MLSFHGLLNAGRSGRELEQSSLILAHACRESLARSWRTPAWESHYFHALDDDEDVSA